MIPLGLKTSHYRAYRRALLSNHVIHITVHVLDLDHGLEEDISGQLLDGQIDFDLYGDVTRTASLQVFDPDHTVGFDKDDPGRGGVFATNMIRIKYGVHVPELRDWVDVPVFTGPVSGLSRDHDILNIEAQGKESLAQNQAWEQRTFPKGAWKQNVIDRLLQDAGERPRRIQLPLMSSKHKLPEPLVVWRMSSRWGKARSVARSMNRQLFYDGRGICRMRSWPNNTRFTFRVGDGGSILTHPQVTYDSENIINTVWVVGGAQKLSGATAEAVRGLPGSHPLSAKSLGRNGKQRRYVEKIEDDTIRLSQEAEDLATERVNTHGMETLDITFDSIPIPDLEPGDLVECETEGFSMPFRLRAWSLPLSAGGVMSVNYRKHVPRPKTKARRRYDVIPPWYQNLNPGPIKHNTYKPPPHAGGVQGPPRAPNRLEHRTW